MSKKVKLSKSILEMKFMKRTKDEVLKQEDAEEGRQLYSSEITDKMMHGTNYILENSFVVCEDLIVGRFSCGGMNPDLERILEKEEAIETQNQMSQQQKKNAEMIKDVSDESMVKHYSNLVKTIGNKFNKFKKRRHENSERTDDRNGRKMQKLS